MTDGAYRRWICDACGYIYDEAKGDPDSGLAPGTRYADIPEDWSCPLCGLRKSDLRALPEAPVPEKSTQSVTTQRTGNGGEDYVVIVGAGVAGWSVAEAIRRREPARPILLISACAGDVYAKPALSVALAQGKSARDLIDMDAREKAQTLGIEVRTHTRVIRIDTARRRVLTSRGGIQYARLVLALGAQQRDLPVAGDGAADILKVNDLASYAALRARLDKGLRHITILGAGLIGCEFAEDLSGAGYEVMLIDPAAQPLASLLPDSLAGDLRRSLEDKGVQWRLNTRLDRLDSAHNGYRATLSNGEQRVTDLVLSAAGLVPNTALARKAGLRIEQGIAVDPHMRSSQAGIYAIGDCAALQGRVYAYIEPIRRQAEAIAADLCGVRQPFESRPPLVQVKTPSLPLTICTGLDTHLAQTPWTLMESGSEGCYLAHREGETLRGFILSGRKTRLGPELYRGVCTTPG